jgi:hypothetical protein
VRRPATLFSGFALLAALAFLAVGCGGGSSESAGRTTEATVPATTAATTTEALTTQAVTTTAPTTTAGGGGVASAAGCRELQDLGQKLAAAQSGSGSAGDLRRAAAAMRDFAERAPADIRADFQLFADYVTRIADAYGNTKPGQPPSAATLAKLQKVVADFDPAKVSAAVQHITSWLSKNCAASR